MGIEEIKRKIIEDAESEAKKIIEEAQRKKEAALEEARHQAEKMKQEAIRKAHEDAERHMKTTISQSQLESIKEMSDFEKQIVREVYRQAYEKFLSLDRSKLEKAFISAILQSGASGNEEVMFSKRLKKSICTPSFLKTLNGAAKKAGLAGNFKFGSGEAVDSDIELAGPKYRILISIEKLLEDEGSAIEKKVIGILKGDHEYG